MWQAIKETLKIIFKGKKYMAEYFATYFPISSDQAKEMLVVTRNFNVSLDLCGLIEQGRTYIQVMREYRKIAK